MQKKISNDGTIRLNRVLSNAGVCSRRDADVYIKAGVVTVNGQVVTELGTKVKPTDKVMFHDQLVQSEKKVYVLLNKPKNCVTTVTDPRGRITVLDIVRGACSERIYPVGRLDRNTTGVLLLTNDGQLADKLTHPRFEKKKIYQVSIDKPLEKEDYDKILKGFQLEDGFIQADELEYVKDGKRKEIGIEIHYGKNRIVRRIFEHLGYKVEKLDRVYFAGLTKYNLPRGRWRHLTEQEVNALKMGAFE
jgi:23S rRNA pseudouridine2605 synthase